MFSLFLAHPLDGDASDCCNVALFKVLAKTTGRHNRPRLDKMLRDKMEPSGAKVGRLTVHFARPLGTLPADAY